MKFRVVGFPVGHSLSPAMMNAGFRELGIEAIYDALEIPTDGVRDALRRLHAEGFAGLNVTVPHKEAALAVAVEASLCAHAIGAANTLVRRDAGWFAENTDGPGFHDWVEEVGIADLLRGEVLVLGAGGSARAVVWALREAGCPRVRVANRTWDRAVRFTVDTRVVAEPPGRSAPRGGLVVNCTSLGLRAADPLPLAGEALAPAGHVLDLVYPETALVRTARAAGIPATDGLGLLVAQGARSFEAWTGAGAPRAMMRAAAQAELARRKKN